MKTAMGGCRSILGASIYKHLNEIAEQPGRVSNRRVVSALASMTGRLPSRYPI